MEEKITEENMAEKLENYWVELWNDGFLAFIMSVLLLLSVPVIAYSENFPRFALIVLCGDFVILAAITLCLLIESIRYKRPIQDIYGSLCLFLMTVVVCYLIYDGYRQLE